MSPTSIAEEEIFQAARRIGSAEARSAYLDQVCRDNGSLREQVEALLAAFDSSDNFLESPSAEIAADVPARDQTISEGPGTVIGPYKLVQQIGEGGMGIVFLAHQEHPVKRQVALKVIKPGMDTRQVIARFEAERQALAMMDHPNIAKVLDAGVVIGGSPVSPVVASTGGPPVSTGRPYFVMELVQGVPITEYCDQCNLTTGDRLDLFVTVCQAVQHAHQKGIIHRDLKPNNVLVAIQDGRATPKIIDFGVAKAINQQLTEHTLMTAFAQIVGTPLYMSPEQAELSPLGVDTRSDIYSLGVLLYELLTGTTPFDKDRLHAAAYDELRRIIREEEPPRPSARISTLAADVATTVAERRHTDTRRLRQTIHGDLDWIVMKCLEKDRNRRYDSAGSLARDIERYLHDEPVQACPPSLSYRLKKFIRRNKVAAAFICLLIASVAALTASNIQSRRNEQRAITESARAQAVLDLLQEMLASSNPDETKGSQYTVRELLDNFSAGLGDQLAGEPEVEAAIHSVIGKSYWRLGVYDRGELHSKKALDLRRELFGADDERVADSLVDYAWNLAEQGRNEEAERHVHDALLIYQRQKSDSHRTVRALWTLQQFMIRQSRLVEADEAANDALALAGDAKDSEFAELPNILHGLADAKLSQEKYDEAEKWARQAVEIHRRVHGDRHPETAWGLMTWASALKGQRKFADAEPPLREALAIFREYYAPEHDAIQGVTESLKLVLQATGDRAGLDALASEVAKRSDDPGDDVRVATLLLKNNPTADQKEEAHRLVRRATEGFAKVAVDYPGDLDRRMKALEGYILAIRSCAAVPGFTEEVDELNRRLEEDVTQLAADFPQSNDCRWRTAVLYLAWAVELVDNATDLPMAERQIRNANEIFENRFLSDLKQPLAWLFLARTYVILGDVQWQLAKLDEAGAAFRRALEIHDEHAAEIDVDPLPIAALDVASDYLHSCLFLVATHRDAEAVDLVRKAALYGKCARNPDESVSILWAIAISQLYVGDDAGYRATCKTLADLPVDDLDDLNKARQTLTWCLAPGALENPSLAVERAEETAASNSLGQAHVGSCDLAAALYRNSEYDRAEEQLEKSIDMYPRDPTPGYETINYSRLLLAMTKWKQDQRDEARRLLAETLPIVDEQIENPSTWSHMRAIVEILRREAVALIEPKDADESVENKSSTSVAD